MSSSSRRSSKSTRTTSSINPPTWRHRTISSASTSLSLVFAESQLGSASASTVSPTPVVVDDERDKPPPIHIPEPVVIAEDSAEPLPPPLAASSNPSPLPQTPIIEDTEPEAVAPALEPNSPPIASPNWFGSLGRARGIDALTSLPSQRSPSIMISQLPEPLLGNSEAVSSSHSSVDEQVPMLPQLPQILQSDATSMMSGTGSESALDTSVSIEEELPDIVRARLNSLNPSTSRFTISLPLLGRPKNPWSQPVPLPANSQSDSQVPLTTGSTPIVGTVETAKPPPSFSEPATPQPEAQSAVESTPLPNPSEPPIGSSVTGADSSSTVAPIDQPLESHQEPDSVRFLRADSEQTTQSHTTIATAASDATIGSTGTANSWWDYIGWKTAPGQQIPTSSSTPVLPFATAQAESMTAVEGAAEGDSDMTPTADSEATVQPHIEASQSEPILPSLKPDEPSLSAATTTPQRPPSISNSVRTTQSQPVYSWYSPWAWYGSATSDAAGTAGNATEKQDAVKEDVGSAGMESGLNGSADTRQLRESEMIKEEALARQSPPSQSPKLADSDLPASATSEGGNEAAQPQPVPISISAVDAEDDKDGGGHTPSSSYWASFFTSPLSGRSRVASIRSKKSQISLKGPPSPFANGEPSTTPVDSSPRLESEAKDEAFPPLTLSESVKNSVKAADAAGQSNSPEKTSPGAAEAAIKGDGKPTDVRDTNSKGKPDAKDFKGKQAKSLRSRTLDPRDLKDSKGKQKEISDRERGHTRKSSISSVSGDPSKDAKEGGGKPEGKRTKTPPPRAPPLPNLVLPTWGDTFHTLPRNVPPSVIDSMALTPAVAPGGWSVGKLVKGVLGYGGSGRQSQQNSRHSHTPAHPSLLRNPSSSSSLNTRPTSVHSGGATSIGTVSSAIAAAYFQEREREIMECGRALPRALDVLDLHEMEARARAKQQGNKSTVTTSPKIGTRRRRDSTQGGNVGRQAAGGCKRVAVIGVHGWFPGAVVRTVLGEPTGTSTKFVNMMGQALEEFQKSYMHGETFKKVTMMPLEGEGTIGSRVEKLYKALLGNKEWMVDLHAADVIFVATHSQGSIVSTHLLDRLIREGHIRTARQPHAVPVQQSQQTESFAGPGLTLLPPQGAQPGEGRGTQRVCCLALCGIHLGPLKYLSNSSLLLPYIQYFESAAAKELFEFQNTESEVSKAYVSALRNVVDHGTKMVYIASLNDQVVPIYSGLFTAASHPLILRALYIDGDAYHSSDFLSNLLVLLIRVLNAGLSDIGLLAHLSEATAGSLNGVGHSTAYEEVATYMLAVKYLFLTNDGLDEPAELKVEPFNAALEQNDYEIPWSLRDLIADDRTAHFFSAEITELRDAFREWHPKTTILRDIKKKLQPIQRLGSVSSFTEPSFTTTTSTSALAMKTQKTQ